MDRQVGTAQLRPHGENQYKVESETATLTG